VVVPSAEPDACLPVHSQMFTTAGTQIAALDAFAAERAYEFALLGFPLRLTDATGARVRPLAAALR